MAYFGGLGAGKGWLKFLFLVDPTVLREVLIATKPVLVVTNARVPAEYVATPVDEYIAAYTRYLDAMLESTESAQKAAMATYMGLAASLDRFSPMSCPDARYKLMHTDEPVVTLRPLNLHFDSRRGQLCTNVMSNLYFGVELSFPRVISLDRDKHEVLYETERFPTHGIFEGVKSGIQKVTKPCKIRSPSREHRTPIRISEGMGERMKRHPGLLAAGLELV
jgi:hypothetical protein